jgi:TIR domain
MTIQDLHSALKTSVLAEASGAGIIFKHVRLQHGRDAFTDTLHAHPSASTTSGIQTTDFLHFLGFRRSPCAFHRSECYCRIVEKDTDVASLTRAVGVAFGQFGKAADELESCGVRIEQPEGWGFFRGKPSGTRDCNLIHVRGDGHRSPKCQKMKESEDEYFKFVFTWIDGAEDKGWTTHYRSRHMPLSPELLAAFSFLRGFSWLAECPEFNFDGCWWRFTPFKGENDSDDAFNRSTEYAHRAFDAHRMHFSRGLELLLEAHAGIERHGLSFLPVVNRPAPAESLEAHTFGISTQPSTPNMLSSALPDTFDVAISYAGPEKPHAEKLASLLRCSGFKVFYDGFYPEQLWGKDLAAFFDRIYRKASRFCVMFVSRDYADRIWTSHERRAAQARAIGEKGNEYILPIRIDDTDLEGLPPTIGYLSLGEHPIERIAELLIKKLTTS